MTAPADNNSFGRYLKKKRLEKGLSLEVVSAETRIGRKILQLIENEDHERLPADVFVKGFLRAYAKNVGADGDEALRRYLSSLNSRRETARYASNQAETDSRFWGRLLVALCALFCLIAATIFVSVLIRGAGQHEQQSAPHETMAAAPVPTAPKPARLSEPVKQPGKVAAEKLLLDIRVIESTWLQVTVDDQATREYSLKPGERLALEAITGVEILVGNAAGIQLKFNGNPVPVSGKAGEVVRIRLP